MRKTFKHSGGLGDIIYSIPTLRYLANLRREIGRGHPEPPSDEPPHLYLEPDRDDPIPPRVGLRQSARITHEQARMLIPLLESQGITASVWDGEPITYDLDRFRYLGIDLARGDVARYYQYAFPEALVDYSKPWLEGIEPDPEYKDAILVNRTLRYRNNRISYKLLNNRPDVYFVGLPNEYPQFGKEVRCPIITAPDYLTLARWIRGCKLFIGNPSFCWVLADAMKVPRMLESYPEMLNVHPHGANGYDFIEQVGFDILFWQLINK